jgi:hypothetical protein
VRDQLWAPAVDETGDGMPEPLLETLLEAQAVSVVRGWRQIESMEGHENRFPMHDAATFRANALAVAGSCVTLTERAWDAIARLKTIVLGYAVAPAALHREEIAVLLSRAMLENPAVWCRVIGHIERVERSRRPRDEVAREARSRWVAALTGCFGSAAVETALEEFLPNTKPADFVINRAAPAEKC